jgi:hypothetical protein
MADEPKFCKDCKHFKQYEYVWTPFGYQGGDENCEHPSLVDVIHGKRLSVTAESQRHRNSLGCGYEGKQFEAGERTPGIRQPHLDQLKEALLKVEEAPAEPARLPLGIFAEPRRWWEFWKGVD